MADYEKKVKQLLLQHGCRLIRHGKGDHTIWHSPITEKNFPVDGKIYIRHIANAIMKQAGINYHF